MRTLSIFSLCLLSALGAASTAAFADKSLTECGVTFYEKKNLKGKSVTFNGPANVADMDKLEFPDGEDIEGDVRSIGTQPDTWMQLYEDDDFKNPKYRLPPSAWTNIKKVESFKVVCRPEMPEDAEGPEVYENPVPGK